MNFKVFQRPKFSLFFFNLPEFSNCCREKGPEIEIFRVSENFWLWHGTSLYSKSSQIRTSRDSKKCSNY